MAEKLLVMWLFQSCLVPGSESPNPEIPELGTGNAVLPSTNTGGCRFRKDPHEGSVP